MHQINLTFKYCETVVTLGDIPYAASGLLPTSAIPLSLKGTCRTVHVNSERILSTCFPPNICSNVWQAAGSSSAHLQLADRAANAIGPLAAC